MERKEVEWNGLLLRLTRRKEKIMMMVERGKNVTLTLASSWWEERVCG